MKRSTLLRSALLLGGLALMGLGALPETRFEVRPGSRFWIDGTSTVDTFTCEAGEVAGTGVVTPTQVAARVAVPVEAFDCGNGRMNRDLRRALRAEDHPEIRFELREAEVLEEPAALGAWVPVQARGTVALAGTERPLSILAEGQRLPDGRVRVRGHHALRMTSFGITPPSALLGLVRAHDDITVRFDLVAYATPSLSHR